MKKTIRDVDVRGKRVLVRVDFNVPIRDGVVLDDTRLRATLPTIRYLIDHEARVILLTHLGRPAGYVVEELRTNPLARHLAGLLDMPVEKIDYTVGPDAQAAARSLEPGQVLFLENVRFQPGETANDDHFASKLALLADLYVDDAFGSAHRMNASIIAITRHLPAVAGFLMEKELISLREVQHEIEVPLVALVGGIRLIDKARFINHVIEHENRVLVGGVLANTFLLAKGLEVGRSVVETAVIGLAKEMLLSARSRIILPVDVVAADDFSPDARRRIVPARHVPPSTCIVDIGPETVEQFAKGMAEVKTVIWNGPMGIVEIEPFQKGTDAVTRKIAGLENILKIAGGGDTMAAVNRTSVQDRLDYVSTGGAAFLEAIESHPLPGVVVLQDRQAEYSIPQDAGRSSPPG